MDLSLTVLSDMSEHIHYNLDDYPLYINDGELKKTEYTAACHWHPDLEFVHVLSGSMDYFVNGDIVHIGEGQAIFVNSLRLHYGFSKEKLDCDYVVTCIHPTVFTQNTKTGVAYFEHKFGLNNPDYLLLDPGVGWQRELISHIDELYKNKEAIRKNPIPAVTAALILVSALGMHIRDAVAVEGDNRDQHIFLNIIKFIQDHYSEKILIEDMANVGRISRVKTYQVFDRYAHMSPIAFLMNYRIAKSAELLRDSNLSIADIATMCGFQTPNYFASVFRKEKGISPREYRNQTKLYLGKS
jgi:AraC-like DNA-binding protein/mannose-6-phosphate isomerase-like protein (cupin superfamily)